jgi:hypothetical protein
MGEDIKGVAECMMSNGKCAVCMSRRIVTALIITK